MKLTELSPRWCGIHHWAPLSPTFYIGVTFLCPHCMSQRLAVLFDPPIDPEAVESKIGKVLHLGNVWNRTGDKFENLSLTPSIDASQHGHWHGTITNGEVL